MDIIITILLVAAFLVIAVLMSWLKVNRWENYTLEDDDYEIYKKHLKDPEEKDDA